MKKVFVMFFSVILVALLTTSFSVNKSDVVSDVGYSLTANDQMIAIVIDSPVPVLHQTEVQTVIDRGGSVPYKGLITSDILVLDNKVDFQCNTNYTIDRDDFTLPILIGFENNPDKYPFASDLGIRKS